MANKPWWSDPKFNKYISENGELNFSGLYKIFEPDIVNPLAPILGEMYDDQEVTQEIIMPSREIDYRNLKLKSRIIKTKGTGRVTKTHLERIILSQDEEIPINSNAIRDEGYHGYSLKRKKNTNRVYIRRFREVKSGNGFMLNEFNDGVIRNINSLVGRLFFSVGRGKLKLGDYVSTDLAEYLHKLWYKV